MVVNKLRVPDEWVNPPVLPLHLVWVRDAYFKLSTCRNSGFDIMPIPWTAIQEYVRYMGLDEEQADWFEYLIDRLDSEVIAYERSKKPKDKNGK